MLTEKQRRFADYYIETGNAAEAARKAGYSKKTADAIGRENLRKPTVSAYIKARLAEMDVSRLADAEEVLEVFSNILRGQARDQNGLPVSVHDRIDAGKAILRRLERIEGLETGANILAQAKEILGTVESVIR